MMMASRRYWYPLMWAGTPISWMMAVTLASKVCRAVAGPAGFSPPSDQCWAASRRTRSTTEAMRQGFIM